MERKNKNKLAGGWDGLTMSPSVFMVLFIMQIVENAKINLHYSK